jgi:hypothetical protein
MSGCWHLNAEASPHEALPARVLMGRCFHFNAEARRGGDSAEKAWEEFLRPVSAPPRRDARVLMGGCWHLNAEARRGGDSAEKAWEEFLRPFSALPRPSGNFSPATPSGRSVTDTPLAQRTQRLPLNLSIVRILVYSAKSPKLRASALRTTASPFEALPASIET